MKISKMNILENKRIVLTSKVILLLALLYFPLFLHLERLPMKIWDEARYAVSACEMNLNGNYLVVYFDGSPENWNTKPPMLIWIQTLMIKIMGVRELAFRLPSALAALFTALLMAYFSKKYLNSFWFGFISAILLVTSYGYVHHHGTRTGDYDSLLTFLMAAYSFSFFIFLESGKVKFVHLFFSMLTLAVLTKSVQAVLFLPGLGILALTYKERIAELFKSKWLYIDFLLFISCSSRLLSFKRTLQSRLP
ncbi:MAG: glycosyltransferase family 39 protein [Bacteroidetes bacterium]|nr:glycosyltransferase family 39 protein [Bacteroidota bacterium]